MTCEHIWKTDTRGNEFCQKCGIFKKAIEAFDKLGKKDIVICERCGRKIDTMTEDIYKVAFADDEGNIIAGVQECYEDLCEECWEELRRRNG